MKGIWLVAVLALCVGVSYSQRQMMSPEDRTKQLTDSLSLSEDQSGKVLVILQAADVERKALFESSGGDRDAMRQAMRSLAEKTDAQIDSLLTEEQKVKYAEMKKRRQERGGMRRRE
jgi:Spy/CpxP family protein refolding chaperone